MKNFFIKIKDLFHKGFLSVILGILFILGILGGLAYGGYILIDSQVLPVKEGTGKITNKKFQNSYIYITYTNIDNIQYPITNYVPENWYLIIKVQKKEGSISVSKHVYYIMQPGNKVRVKYKIGRFSKNLYLINILGNSNN